MNIKIVSGVLALVVLASLGAFTALAQPAAEKPAPAVEKSTPTAPGTFVDADKDGVCDNSAGGGLCSGACYSDADGDGVCDNRQAGDCQGCRRGQGKGRCGGNGQGRMGQGGAYADANGDGVCDNQGRGAGGKGRRCGQGRCAR